MPRLLWTSYFRYLKKNLWLLVLSLFAIAVGVAVVLAIDVASISAKKSFNLSLQALTGRSNYALTGAGVPMDETFYKTLRVDWGFRRSAPVVEGYVSFPSEKRPNDPTAALPLTLLGVDPFADREVRSWTGGQFQRDSGSTGLSSLVGSSNQVIATVQTAQRLAWEQGEEKRVLVGAELKSLKLVGVFEPASDRSSQALDNVLLTDISVAQAVLSKFGKLDRVDLVLTDDGKERLQSLLPKSLSLQQAGQSQRTASELSAAFHTNLRALSYLCLLVASFLIFNVVSFSVSHRRKSLGKLRILGISNRELMALLLGEALLLGAVGSSLGLLLGFALGRGLVPLVTRTLNDLYYVHAITQFQVEPLLIMKALASGLLATLVAAIVPARMAAETPALDLLRRVQSRESNLKGAQRSFLGGLLVALSSVLLLVHPSLTASLFSLLLMVLASALMLPLLLVFFVELLSKLSKGVASLMALRGIKAFLGRTSIATIALTIAVAATISIAMMVSSFRGTLTSWLETTLTADIYLTLKDRAGLSAGAHLDADKVEESLGLPGIKAWIGQRVRRVPSNSGETFLVGVKTAESYKDSLVFLEASENAWKDFEAGEGVFVTEPYARRQGWQVGSVLRLATPLGPKDMKILGVYYSYAPDRNLAIIGIDSFREFFSDENWSGLGYYVDSGADVTEVVTQLKRVFGEKVEVRATGNLKALALEIFERTFTVTEVLRFLALGIAFVGVFLSLLALSFERTDEVRVLRALGFKNSELFSLSLKQSLTLGGVAGLLAFPLGILLSKVMISVINRRAFGWTIGFEPDWAASFESLLLALAAALIAGLYPAWKWSQTAGDEAWRERE